MELASAGARPINSSACPLVLHLTDKLRPVKWRRGCARNWQEQILLTIGFIKNLPLLKKRLAVPKNDSACNVAFFPQNFFGTDCEKTNMESRRMQINIRIGISYQDQNFVDDACFGWPKMATAKYVTSPLLCFDPKAKWMLVQCPLRIYSR
ncbi:hypothetical protein OIU77_012316 [Salix suchowensis]|uniref:Uncharacterized protein n=1 Tax=Salix suchowensis TaxID=1278906 RepID=A0ABQ9A3A5_9ROSI|nr:hypothetical protein OIU77_012316 [Salix suchowensis]